MNKQRNVAYGNAPDTLPAVKSIPNPMANGKAVASPVLKPCLHERRDGKSNGSKNKL